MDELNDELLLQILEFTDSPDEYTNICKAVGRKVYTPHMLKVHAKIEVNEKGSIRTYLDGKLHSFNDEPAVFFTDGYKAWYKEGNYYREGGKPVIIYADGTKWMYNKGNRDSNKHDVIYGNGSQKWWKN